MPAAPYDRERREDFEGRNIPPQRSLGSLLSFKIQNRFYKPDIFSYNNSNWMISVVKEEV